MPFSGTMFVRNQNFQRDRDAGPPDSTISAARVDDEFSNLAEGLTQAMTANATTRALLPTPGAGAAGQVLTVNPAGTAFMLTHLAARGLHVFTQSLTWTVPAYVSAIMVVAVGPGGRGAMNSPGSYTPFSGGGGGAGGMVIARVPVSMGQELRLQVGVGSGETSSGSVVQLLNTWSLVAFPGQDATGISGALGGAATANGLPDAPVLKVPGSGGQPGSYFANSTAYAIHGGVGGGTIFGSPQSPTGGGSGYGLGGFGAGLTLRDKEANIQSTGNGGRPGIILIAY